MHDDDAWDEPAMLVHPDDNRKADEFAMRIDEVLQELVEAHSHTALHLSLALSALQSATDKPHATLCPAERDELTKGLATAHAFARRGLDVDHDVLRRGIDAATGQVLYLAADGERRRCWSNEDLGRLAAAARIVRDDLHNRCLLAELQELEGQYAIGELADDEFGRIVRARHARIAANRVNIATLERELASKPPRTRPPLRLVS